MMQLCFALDSRRGRPALIFPATHQPEGGREFIDALAESYISAFALSPAQQRTRPSDEEKKGIMKARERDAGTHVFE